MTAGMSGIATVDDALAAADGVDGWMSPDQIVELHRAASTTVAGEQIVEIGSFRGRSTVVLATSAPVGVTVVAIDPHAGNDRGPQEIEGFAAEAGDDHHRFLANLARAGVTDRVRHVRTFSDQAHGAVDGPIDVLLIDGAHRYAPARQDIHDWGRRVAPGGVLLIHDSFSSIGVTLAIGRELLVGKRFRYVGRARSLAVYHADLDGSWQARLGNATRQLAQLPWFLRNLAIKVALSAGLGGPLERITGERPEWPY
jgi:predicted O-methyltransferase YrrM